MPEVASQQVVTQLGVESVSGTGVPANKQLIVSDVTIQPDPDVKEFEGAGRRFMVAAGINKNRTTGKAGGPANYTDIVYWASAAWGAATITTPVGATTARKWAWDLNLAAALGQKSFTIENGSSVRAQKAPYLIVPDIGEKWGRDDTSQEVSFIAQTMADGITLTGAPTALPAKPQLGAHHAYFYDTSSGTLGTTKLTRVWDASWSWKTGLIEKYPQDSASITFATHVDLDPTPELYMLVAADASGMAMWADMTADTTKYVRFQATGPKIETGVAGPDQFYLKTLDVPVRLVGQPTELKDEKGIRAIGFKFRPIEDLVAGFAWRFSVVNTLAAL